MEQKTINKADDDEDEKTESPEETITIVPQRLEYVVGIDSLGQDRPFTETQIEEVHSICRIFQTHLTRIHQYLYQNEMTRWNQLINLQTNLEVPDANVLKKELKKTKKELIEIYEKDDLGKPHESHITFIYYQQKLLSFQSHLFDMGQMLIFRGPLTILSSFFYLLSFPQESVLDMRTMECDWEKMRKLFTPDLFEKIQKFDPRNESKLVNIPIYMRMSSILATINEFKPEEIQNQNILLYYILEFIQKSIRLKNHFAKMRKEAKINEQLRLEAEEKKRQEDEELRLEEEERQRELELEEKENKENDETKDDDDDDDDDN